MLLEVIQAVIPLLGTQAAAGVESLRVTSRAGSPLLLAQGITEAHNKSLMPHHCLRAGRKVRWASTQTVSSHVAGTGCLPLLVWGQIG